MHTLFVMLGMFAIFIVSGFFQMKLQEHRVDEAREGDRQQGFHPFKSLNPRNYDEEGRKMLPGAIGIPLVMAIIWFTLAVWFWP